jgi:hypothetical protein
LALALFGGLDDVDGVLDTNSDSIWVFEERQESLRIAYARQQTLVNRGAYDELLYGGALSSGDERYMVDGRFDPGANEVTARTLQREVRTAGRGHGGGGKGSKKEVVFDGVDRAKQRNEAAVHALAPIRLPIHEIKGLTYGELCVLETRTQEFVAALLTTIHDEINRGAIPETEAHFVQLGNPSRRFYVGLEPDVHRTFHCSAFRGAARAALVNAAHSLDCARIARIDAGWTSAAGSS